MKLRSVVALLAWILLFSPGANSRCCLNAQPPDPGEYSAADYRVAEFRLRARCRDPQRGGAFNSTRLSPIEPDKVYEYQIDFWRATGNAFLKGHRIRIEISSSYFPYFLRNLNTGADNVGLETAHVVAQQTIYHDAARPSHVVLPVMPAPGDRERRQAPRS